MPSLLSSPCRRTTLNSPSNAASIDASLLTCTQKLLYIYQTSIPLLRGAQTRLRTIKLLKARRSVRGVIASGIFNETPNGATQQVCGTDTEARKGFTVSECENLAWGWGGGRKVVEYDPLILPRCHGDEAVEISQ